jgi:hypothetical protein
MRLHLTTVILKKTTGDFDELPAGRLVVTEHAAQRVIQRRASLDWREPMRELGDALMTAWCFGIVNKSTDEERVEISIGTPNGNALLATEQPALDIIVVSWLPIEKLRPEQLAAMKEATIPDWATFASGRKRALLGPPWHQP